MNLFVYVLYISLRIVSMATLNKLISFEESRNSAFTSAISPSVPSLCLSLGSCFQEELSPPRPLAFKTFIPLVRRGGTSIFTRDPLVKPACARKLVFPTESDLDADVLSL